VICQEEATQFDFCPETFSLPGEYLMFVETFKKNPDVKWIMKPVCTLVQSAALRALS